MLLEFHVLLREIFVIPLPHRTFTSNRDFAMVLWIFQDSLLAVHAEGTGKSGVGNEDN